MSPPTISTEEDGILDYEGPPLMSGALSGWETDPGSISSMVLVFSEPDDEEGAHKHILDELVRFPSTKKTPSIPITLRPPPQGPDTAQNSIHTADDQGRRSVEEPAVDIPSTVNAGLLLLTDHNSRRKLRTYKGRRSIKKSEGTDASSSFLNTPTLRDPHLEQDASSLPRRQRLILLSQPGKLKGFKDHSTFEFGDAEE